MDRDADVERRASVCHQVAAEDIGNGIADIVGRHGAGVDMAIDRGTDGVARPTSPLTVPTMLAVPLASAPSTTLSPAILVMVIPATGAAVSRTALSEPAPDKRQSHQ